MSKNKKPLIVPTVGRIVWYYPEEDYQYPHVRGAPLAAFITCVHSDLSVNLTIFDINGSHHKKVNVELVDGDDNRPDTGHAEWMPYQKGQAAKTEKLGEEFKEELKKELKEEIGAELREGLNEDLEEEPKTEAKDKETPKGGSGASNPEPQGEAK